MKASLLAALVLLPAFAAGAGAVAGAPPGWPDALTGRLAHIKDTRLVHLGYREQAIPFSYVDAGGKPVGYTLDLCAAVVAAIAEDLGGAPIAVDYVAVTAENRIERVLSGAVDLECGATTSTAERRQQVAFSPAIFVTGTRIAVRRGSAVHGYADLRGLPVAVVRGTTSEAAMRTIDRLQRLALRFVAADDYREALSLLETGKVAALAADDVLLRGLLADAGRTTAVRLVGAMLSFEPYGIVYPRGDPGLAAAVERALRELARSREIVWIYDRWLLRPLPGRGPIGLPMSVQLRRSLELLGLPPN